MASRDPRVTVLMPVRDAARHLPEALRSILDQTFGDFELLVVDDASTDGSAALVERCTDPRVRLVKSPTGTSQGLAAALNVGLDLARGDLIARMDGDDVSLPDRLARQTDYMDAHPECAAVAVKIRLITEDGVEDGEWPADRETTSYEDILRRLPLENCIAHPGVMIRTDVLRRYRYRLRTSAQDYDLWLRLCADGLRIEKIDAPLVRYRVNPGSVSARRRRQRSGVEVDWEIRGRFVAGRILHGHLNGFDRSVLARVLADGSLYARRRLGRAVGGAWKRLRKPAALA